MSAFSRSFCTAASRSARSSSSRAGIAASASIRAAARPLASHLSRQQFLISRNTMAASFSTVPARKGDAVASPAAPRDYDPEIVDMASYIHNYNVDSDLAVGFYVRSFHSFAVVY